MSQQTFAMLKTDAVKRKLIGKILDDISNHPRLSINSIKMGRLTKAQAERFYQEHKERSFFGELVEYMSSGDVVMAILEGDNAIHDYRMLIGSTDPKDAAEGTLRKKYATSKAENCVHGSDSTDAAEREIAFFHDFV